MKVQVLHIDACPDWTDAVTSTRAALDALGIADVEVEPVLLRTEADAAAVTFGGSPTILVDGTDLFPGTPITDLACRVYFTEHGMAGLPSQKQLQDALTAALL